MVVVDPGVDADQVNLAVCDVDSVAGCTKITGDIRISQRLFDGSILGVALATSQRSPRSERSTPSRWLHNLSVRIVG